jgi:signal transduction histidine kinase/CheY-like chemotaxis protein
VRLLLIEDNPQERQRFLTQLRAAMPGSLWSAAGSADALESGSPEAVVLSMAAYMDLVADLRQKEADHARLQQSQRLEGLATLARGIAHDLNNALTPIQLGLDLLRDALTDDKRGPLEDILQTKLDRATDLVRQLLLFARDPGALGSRPSMRVAVRPVLTEVEQILRQDLVEAVTLELRVGPDVSPVWGEMAHLRQIMLNLGRNARDAMPNGGRLTVTATNAQVGEHRAALHPPAAPGAYIVITVTDTGAGIPAEDLDRIFDPFYTTKEAGNGTGLGLSAVLGLVKAQGGFIEVDSTVGRGSEFRVYLPAAEAAATDQPSVPALPRGRGQMILVIDDEEQIRDLARATLEGFNYQALTAGDGAEGAALFAKHRGEVKAVITDMMMPVRDGPATIRALQALDPAVPIVVSSGLSSPPAADLSNMRVHAFLQKPYSASQLLQTLHRLLGGSGGA